MRRQQELSFRTWGGARPGAGRKPRGGRSGETHTARPELDARAPLHVTMRVAGVPSLRSEVAMTALRRAFHDGRARTGFRLVHYAVQPNHLHFVVEAASAGALS
ncbi:MAG TPA: hypothetical protein VHB21_13380, partial [Minicystis sp.]|nr:hypothetical protein [Minicystis sp.]